jgi:hypothetical protein
MKIDPYDHKESYLAWKEKTKGGIAEISKENSKIILNYLYDMEYGLNVGRSSKKGARSYIRLNNLKQRLVFLAKRFEELYQNHDLTTIDERTLHKFFIGMANGDIKRLDGRIYRSSRDYVKLFKSFWHWHQKVNRKRGD